MSWRLCTVDHPHRPPALVRHRSGAAGSRVKIMCFHRPGNCKSSVTATRVFYATRAVRLLMGWTGCFPTGLALLAGK